MLELTRSAYFLIRSLSSEMNSPASSEEAGLDEEKLILI